MCDNFLRSSTEEIDLSGPLSLTYAIISLVHIKQALQDYKKKLNMLNTLPEKTQIPPEPNPLPGHKSW